MTESTRSNERCPHGTHKYWRNTFEVCPNCHLAADAPAGSAPVPVGADATKAKEEAAFQQQPPEVRLESMIRRIMDDQARTASATESLRLALWILVIWFVALPLLALRFFIAR